MRFPPLRVFLFLLSFLAATGCAVQNRRSVTSTPASAIAPPPKPSVSHLIPGDLGFAEDFVQSLSEAGWVVKEVRHSKFNSFFRETKKAAFVRTNKGVVEAIFFETEADVERIRVTEEQTGDSNYHRYLVRNSPLTDQRIEGRSCFFARYRNAFIITADRELSEAVERLPGRGS